MSPSSAPHPIPHTVIRSDRKTLSIQITADAAVIVRVPRRTKNTEIEALLLSRRAWIEEKQALVRTRRSAAAATLPADREAYDIAALTARAKADIPPMVAIWAARMGVSYGRITLRHQSTRWGSCSSKGNLNFNCALMLCPVDVQEYVIIHELCHRRHMNHSAAFWGEVRRYCPSYERWRDWLKVSGGELLRRMREYD